MHNPDFGIRIANYASCLPHLTAKSLAGAQFEADLCAACAISRTHPSRKIRGRIPPRDTSDMRKRDPEMVLEETDNQLIEACRRGESVAFRELFERYKDKVYSIALRYSGDAQTAEDIAQDTFVKLFAAIGGFRGDSSFDSWLYRMVVNSCFDHKRRTRRFLPLIAGVFDLLRAPGATALEDVMREEMSGCVRTVVDGLPPEQRMVIVLRYTQGLSYEEIGEAMGCSPGTVASRLNRVHKVLGRRLTHLAGPNRGKNRG